MRKNPVALWEGFGVGEIEQREIKCQVSFGFQHLTYLNHLHFSHFFTSLNEDISVKIPAESCIS